MASGSGSSSGPGGAPTSYSCNLCPKTFTSWQALGGHQNAHRKERYAAKRLENERKMAQARQAHFEHHQRFVLHPTWRPDFNAPPPDYGSMHGYAVGPSPSGGGGARQGSEAGPDSEQETDLDLTLKL